MPVELKRTGWRVCSPGMARHGVLVLGLCGLLAACSSSEPPCQKKVTAVVAFLGSACGSVEVVCDGEPVELTTGGLGKAICADYVCGIINETETLILTFDWAGGSCELRGAWDVPEGSEPFVRPLALSCEPETFDFTAGETHPCERDSDTVDDLRVEDILSEVGASDLVDVEPETGSDSAVDDLGGVETLDTGAMLDSHLDGELEAGGDSEDTAVPDAAPECEGEGSMFSHPDKFCCPGLKKMKWYMVLENNTCQQIFSESYVCTYCFDGVCGLGEDFCICPADCPAP